MDENTMIKIKCPFCDKEYGVSLNTFDVVDAVEIQCDDGTLRVEMDKKTKKLIIIR